MLLKRLLSPKYLATAKKRLYYQSRVDFYAGKNAVPSKSSLETLLTDKALNASLTSKSIQIQNIPFGSSTKQLMQIKGKPNYSQTNDLVLKQTKILYYRENLFGVKCILQFHFLNDALFLGRIELRNNQDGFGEKIEELIKEKYAVNELMDNTLIDGDKNIIQFANSIIPSITYFTGYQDIHNTISRQLKKKELKSSQDIKAQKSQILEMI